MHNAGRLFTALQRLDLLLHDLTIQNYSFVGGAEFLQCTVIYRPLTDYCLIILLEYRLDKVSQVKAYSVGQIGNLPFTSGVNVT